MRRTETPEEIRAALALRVRYERDMYGRHFGDADDYISFADFIADRGHAFHGIINVNWEKAAPLIQRQRAGRCFDAAEALYLWSGGTLRYAEGYCGTTARHHAWNVTYDGYIVDTTVDHDCSVVDDYLGIVVDPLIRNVSLQAYADRRLRWNELAALTGYRTLGTAAMVMAKRNQPLYVPFETVGPWLTRNHFYQVLTIGRKT